jgi:ParB/RepB/Spo0J family partition protein
MVTSATSPYQVGTEHIVKTSQVIPMKGQPRTWFDPKKQNSFARGLKRAGQLESVTVIYLGGEGEDARFELINGERRWRACIINGTTIRVLIREVKDSAEHFLHAAVSNFGGESNTPLEIAYALERIKADYGMTDTELSEFFGKSHAWSTQYLGLLKLHPEVRAMMSPEHGDKMLKFWSGVSLSPFPPEEQLRLAKRITGQKLKGAEVRILVRKAMKRLGVSRGGKGKQARTPNRDYEMLVNYLARSTRDAHNMLSLSPQRFVEMFASRQQSERVKIIGEAQRCIKGFQQIIQYVGGKSAMRFASTS